MSAADTGIKVNRTKLIAGGESNPGKSHSQECLSGTDGVVNDLIYYNVTVLVDCMFLDCVMPE